MDDDRFDAIGPENPAYPQFREMIEKADGLDWARIEHDEKEVDITMKGIVIARFIPTDDGFRALFPSGPDYGSQMEDSGDDRDGLTKQIRVTKGSDTYEARVSVRTAYRWADSMVDDDEWMDL